jgi:hypothetical protein
MVTLVDGKGQLGGELKKLVRVSNIEGIIYHTWNIDDPSEEIQRCEYEKFVDFVDDNKDEDIYFISTKQGRQIHYLHYKLKAELYLLEKARLGHIIRIPKLIGKGICQKFRDGNIVPFDEIEEIMHPEEAACAIMNIINEPDKINIVCGERINKQMIYQLIKYGAKHES